MFHTSITYEMSFFESGEKITRMFHLLANVEFYEKKKEKSIYANYYVVFLTKIYYYIKGSQP